MNAKLRKEPRQHGLDLLRFYLMILGVLLHSFCAYLTSDTIAEFPVHDPTTQHAAYDALVLWIHSFRMPLFFMISGFFTMHSLSKKSGMAYLEKRIRRIALPFVASCMTLLPVFHWLLSEFQRTEKLEFQLSFLWFLYYLFLFNLIVIACRKLYLRWVYTQQSTKHFIAFTGSLFIFSTLFIGLSGTGGVLMTSDKIFPNLGILIFYFFYFAFGSALWCRRKFGVQPFLSIPLWLQSLCVFISSLTYIFWVQKIFQGHISYLWPTSFLHSLTTPMLCLVFFNVFSKLQVSSVSRAQYLAASSYTVYLVHPLLVAALVPLLSGLPSNALLKPALVFSLALTLSLAIYHFAVRTTFLRNYI